MKEAEAAKREENPAMVEGFKNNYKIIEHVKSEVTNENAMRVATFVDTSTKKNEENEKTADDKTSNTKPLSNAEYIKKKFAEHKLKKNTEKTDFNPAELEWIQLNQDLAAKRFTGETQVDKLKRKLKENPLIPLGCLLTTGFLLRGLIAFGRKDSSKSQVMMRGRIAAQGFTVFGLMTGIFFSMKKSSEKKAVAEEQVST